MSTTAKKAKKKFKISSLIIYIALIFWGLTTVFPFIWVVLNSFKSSRDVILNSFAWPTNGTMQNYITAFSRLNILNAYKTSLTVSGCVTILVMVIATMMAFGMTRYSFKGKPIMYSIIIGSLMFPAFATIVPVMTMMTRAGMINHMSSAILVQTAGNLAFSTIVMMGFLQGIPLEMEEAAYMEGANVRKVFLRIIIPLVRPSLATVAIFTFLWSYNDLFTLSSLLRSKTIKPICNLLKEISSMYGTDYGLMAASVTLIVIPIMIVYIALQKNIIKGLTAGAVKG